MTLNILTLILPLKKLTLFVLPWQRLKVFRVPQRPRRVVWGLRVYANYAWSQKKWTLLHISILINAQDRMTSFATSLSGGLVLASCIASILKWQCFWISGADSQVQLNKSVSLQRGYLYAFQHVQCWNSSQSWKLLKLHVACHMENECLYESLYLMVSGHNCPPQNVNWVQMHQVEFLFSLSPCRK